MKRISKTFLGPDVEATSISSGVSLSTTMLAVPPNDVVVFEVALELNCDSDSGNIDADFASGDFQVRWPGARDSKAAPGPGRLDCRYRRRKPA